jgi:amino acid transporter
MIDEECTGSAGSTARKPGRGLGVRALAAAMYLMVAGGPYGLEELVAKVGFGRGLAILAVVPMIWAMPVAMMAAELAAAIPEEGGYYAWVRRALGPFWGAQEAWLSFAASLFDMGIYPALFIAYLSRFWPPAAEHPFLIGALFVAAGCAVNLAPIGAVGEGGIALTSLLLLPFVLLVAGIGLPMISHGSLPFHAQPVTEESPDFLGALLIGLWNFMGWDNGTTVEAEQSSGAQRTFPRAIFLATLLVGVTYMIPVLVAGLTGVDPAGWTTGSWADFASDMVGPWLGKLTVCGALVSSFGMFAALVLSYSRLVHRVAEDGLLPPFLRRRSARGVPYAAVIFCGVAWLATLGLPFAKLVILDLMLYGTSLLLEFIALIVLRIREPELLRPFRIPGGMFGVCILAVPPAALMIAAFVRNSHESLYGVPALLVGGMMVALGPLLYVATARHRQLPTA